MKPYMMSIPKCCSDHSEGDTIYKRESSLGWQIPNGVTSKQKRCPDVAFIHRSREYHLTAVEGPFDTYFITQVMLVIKDPTVSV
jgi:hypothetical protein